MSPHILDKNGLQLELAARISDRIRLLCLAYCGDVRQSSVPGHRLEPVEPHCHFFWFRFAAHLM
jgi:hypothetical protein